MSLACWLPQLFYIWNIWSLPTTDYDRWYVASCNHPVRVLAVWFSITIHDWSIRSLDNCVQLLILSLRSKNTLHYFKHYKYFDNIKSHIKTIHVMYHCSVPCSDPVRSLVPRFRSGPLKNVPWHLYFRQFMWKTRNLNVTVWAIMATAGSQQLLWGV